MRRFLALLLVFTLLVGGLAVMPSLALADNDKYKKIPPGQAKKPYFNFEKLWEQEWDDFLAQLAKKQAEFSGTVRFIYSLDSKTWIAVETKDNILRTAYFPSGSVPDGLEVGVALSVKVQGYKILESSLTEVTDIYSHLTLLLKTNPAVPKADQEVTFKPQLINKSVNAVTLSDAVYRFSIKKVGSSQETTFTGSHTQTITIPAKNTAEPVSLAVPSQDWTPASAGNYVITRAQLKQGDGEWHQIHFQQPQQTLNLLTANQSNIESSTSGFSPYGHDTYAGSTLKRDTGEDWQGQASLRVTTNGVSPWQGVNVSYEGSRISGALTYSFYIKGAQGVPMRVKIYDNTNGTYPSGGTLAFTGSGSWQRKAVTFTPSDSSKQLSLQVTLDNDYTSTVFWLDGLQLEQDSSASAWVVGGSTQEGVFKVVE